jgi:hypothetical protein
MKTMRHFARALALLWAGFWTSFFLAESLAWHAPWDRMTTWLAVGLAFVILALLAWRWEVVGGLLLMAAGVLVPLAYWFWGPRALPVATRAAILLAFGVPPVAAGALFLMRHLNRAGPRGARG